MCPTGTALARGGQSNLRSAFDVLDADGDGKISRDDLRVFYAGISGADTSEIDSMITVADSNKDGFVEYDEFEKVLGAEKEDRRLGVMEDAFRVMDKDGDGKVGHDDLKSYLRWAGFEAGDEDVKGMMRLGGGEDENGGVTFQGFLKILAL